MAEWSFEFIQRPTLFNIMFIKIQFNILIFIAFYVPALLQRLKISFLVTYVHGLV